MDSDCDIPQKIEAIGNRRSRGVTQTKAVLEDSAENHRTRRRTADHAIALEYVSKFLFRLCPAIALGDGFRQTAIEPDATRAFDTVSYTHLTLPTSDLV